MPFDLTDDLARYGHDAADRIDAALAFAPDGARLAVAIPGRVIVFDARDGVRVAEHAPMRAPGPLPTRLPPDELAFTADGRHLVLALRDDESLGWPAVSLCVFAGDDERPRFVWSTEGPNDDEQWPLQAWALAPDGASVLVATAGVPGLDPDTLPDERGAAWLGLRDLATGRRAWIARLEPARFAPGADDYGLDALALSRDGRRAAVACLAFTADGQDGPRIERVLHAFEAGAGERETAWRASHRSDAGAIDERPRARLAFGPGDDALLFAGAQPGTRSARATLALDRDELAVAWSPELAAADTHQPLRLDGDASRVVWLRRGPRAAHVLAPTPVGATPADAPLLEVPGDAVVAVDRDATRAAIFARGTLRVVDLPR